LPGTPPQSYLFDESRRACGTTRECFLMSANPGTVPCMRRALPAPSCSRRSGRRRIVPTLSVGPDGASSKPSASRRRAGEVRVVIGLAGGGVLVRRGSSTRSRIVVATQFSWFIQLERPHRADRSARVGDVAAAPGSPPGGDGHRGRVCASGPGACRRGGERTPTCRAPNGVVAERQLSCRARVPPHATLPGRGAPGVQLRGDLRPGEALSPQPDDPLTDPLGHRPPTSHTPIVVLRLEAVAGGLSASPNRGTTCITCITSGAASTTCSTW